MPPNQFQSMVLNELANLREDFIDLRKSNRRVEIQNAMILAGIILTGFLIQQGVIIING